ncbi:MAG: T9SS type A sorting domain-containing protein, partial [Bacteroidetes bacterium]|nr:T9SS type A sorting domain-containing protein [Bacteroidota bacterium]
LNNIYGSINQSVYRWNGFGWIQLGSTIPSSNSNGTALTISTDAAGNVYAGGFFKDAAGGYYVAKWNGFIWSALGTGSASLNANNPILTTATDAAGNIYAAGQFFNSSGKRYVAKWNGTNWAELGTGANALNANAEINTITTDAAGNVYAGGQFSNTSGKTYVAKWNGTNWTEIGGLNALNAGSRVLTILAITDTEIYAAGQFTNASGKCYVAKWNGSNWSELGGTNSLNVINDIRTIAKDPSGNVYCAGNFTDLTGKTYVSRWNGSTWAKVGVESFSSSIGSAGIYAIEIDGTGKIYAAGDFINTQSFRHVVNLNGNNWELTGLPGTGMLTAAPFTGAAIKSMVTDIKGNLYAACGLGYVAKWNDTIWQPLGQGANALNANSGINSIVRDRAGNIYAAGGFTNASGKRYVAKWNGTGWSEVGGANGLNANQSIHSIAVDFSGNVYATGAFTNGAGKHYIARWNGTIWEEIAVPNVPIMSDKTFLTTDSTGFVIAGVHDEHNLYAFLTRWNGTAWIDLGLRNGGTSSSVGFETDVISIAVDKFNNIYTVAGFLGDCQVRKWNGSAWSSLGPSTFFTSAFGLYADTTGRIYASGTHLNAVGGYRDDVFNWNGTDWIKVSATHTLSSNFYRTALTIDLRGRIYSAGDSTTPFFGTYGLVSVYDTLFPEKPVIRNISDKCVNAATAKGKLDNPPRLPGTVKIFLDGNPVTYNPTDSSFTYFTNATTPIGSHRVLVQYLYYIHTIQNDSSYSVTGSGLPAVNIASTATTICAGQNIIFTAAPVNGGSTPSYQWKVNGVNAGTNSAVFSSAALTNGSQVSVVMTSNSLCASSPTATSNTITITVTPALVPAVVITASSTSICTGTPVSFTATPTNGGSAPVYQWQVNGINAGTNSNSFTTSALTNGAQVKVILTSNAGCVSPATATSNSIAVTVSNPSLVPAVIISGNTNVNQGQSSLLTASTTNGGTTPVYQWKDSTATHTWQTIAGAVSATHNYLPQATGDRVKCEMISNASCLLTNSATSNVIVFNVADTSTGGRGYVHYFPNPVSTVLYLDRLSPLDNWQTMETISLDGRMVIPQRSIANQTRVELNVSRLQRGQYILILKNADGVKKHIPFMRM